MMPKKCFWRAAVTGPRAPLPTGMRSIERTGVTSTAVPQKNASSARYVLGAKLTPVEDLDLRLLGAVVSRNGQVVETGAGAAVLGNPARCVAWLANTLSQFGEKLEAGNVILAGALHRSFAVEPGDVVRAEFARLGAVTARFAE